MAAVSNWVFLLANCLDQQWLWVSQWLECMCVCLGTKCKHTFGQGPIFVSKKSLNELHCQLLTSADKVCRLHGGGHWTELNKLLSGILSFFTTLFFGGPWFNTTIVCVWSKCHVTKAWRSINLYDRREETGNDNWLHSSLFATVRQQSLYVTSFNAWAYLDTVWRVVSIENSVPLF